MSDIFREVDEALQREKAAQFWKNYGPTLVLAAIVLVASTGATTAWRAWSAHQDRLETAKLVTAAENPDLADAMQQAASNTNGGHKAIALMNAAAGFAAKNDYAKASELYAQVESDGSAPSDLRDLAIILNTRAMGFEKTQDYKKMAERLDPIAANGTSPFQLQAKLDAALLYGDGLKDYTRAVELLEGFDGEDVPPSLKEKATALKHVYAYELSQTTPAPAKQ